MISLQTTQEQSSICPMFLCVKNPSPHETSVSSFLFLIKTAQRLSSVCSMFLLCLKSYFLDELPVSSLCVLPNPRRCFPLYALCSYVFKLPLFHQVFRLDGYITKRFQSLLLKSSSPMKHRFHPSVSSGNRAATFLLYVPMFLCV